MARLNDVMAQGVLHPSHHFQYRDDEVMSAQSHPHIVRSGITVDDLVKLATAGVKVELDKIAEHVIPSPHVAPPPRLTFENPHLIDPIVDRWERFERAKHHPNHDMSPFHFPFHLSAYVRGDKVHVFVAAHDRDMDPTIIEDDVKLFPSDAFMAKLHLMLETQPTSTPEEFMRTFIGNAVQQSSPLR